MIEKMLKEFARKNNLRVVKTKIDEKRGYGFCRAIGLHNNFEASYHFDRENLCWF